MVYGPRKKKISQFTAGTAITDDVKYSSLQDGINKTFTQEQLIADFADVYGASLRTFEFESDLVVSDIQIDEYCIVEENRYTLYKITSAAANLPNIGLDSGFTAERVRILQQASPSTYAEILAENPDLYAEDDVIYLSGDGIAGDFKVVASAISASSTGVQLSNATWNAAGKHLARVWDEITVYTSWFDHSADITSAIKSAIELIKPSASAAGGGIVQLPAGSYTVDETILAKGGSNLVFSRIWIRGAGKAATNLTKSGSGTGDGDIDAVFQLASDDGSLSLTNAFNITISDMNIFGGAYGIYGKQNSAGIHVHDCYVLGTTAGLSFHTMWQSRFERLDPRGATGFQMRSTGTSNWLNSIYCRETTVNGFELRGGYSHGSDLAVDASTGNAYNITFGEWDLSGVGCESPDISNVIFCANGMVKLSNFKAFNLDETNADLNIINASSSGAVEIEGISVQANVSGTPQTMAGQLLRNAATSRITMKGFIELTDVWPLSAEDAITTSSPRVVECSGFNTSTPFFVRTGGQVGLGINSSTQSGYDAYLDNYHDTPYQRGVAIITNVTNYPTTRSDGTDISAFRGGNQGDIWLCEDVDDLGAIGYVKTDVSSLNDALSSGTYRKIQYNHGGTTANRPTVRLEVGQTYFDTSLGHPIWYDANGSTGWCDATGTAA